MYYGKNVCHCIEIHTPVNNVKIKIVSIFDYLAKTKKTNSF